MTWAILYPGELRTWEKCRQNHAVYLPTGKRFLHTYEHPGDTVCTWSPIYLDPDEGLVSPAVMWWNLMRLARRVPKDFDGYIRCRTDILFESRVPVPEKLEPRTVYIPDCWDWAFQPADPNDVRKPGLNDQVCLCDYETLQVYASLYDCYLDYLAEGLPLHAETLLRHHLERHGIAIVRLPVKHSLCRK